MWVPYGTAERGCCHCQQDTALRFAHLGPRAGCTPEALPVLLQGEALPFPALATSPLLLFMRPHVWGARVEQGTAVYSQVREGGKGRTGWTAWSHPVLKERSPAASEIRVDSSQESAGQIGASLNIVMSCKLQDALTFARGLRHIQPFSSLSFVK